MSDVVLSLFDTLCEPWYNRRRPCKRERDVASIVLRKFLTLSILIGTALWLVLSYLPGVRSWLPQFSWQALGAERAFSWLAPFSLGAFVAIQLGVLWHTLHLLWGQRSHGRGDVQGFPIRLGMELFWAALPLVLTFGLAAASYRLWSALAAQP